MTHFHFPPPQLFAAAAALKSIDYNVAMTFILNNNNNNRSVRVMTRLVGRVGSCVQVSASFQKKILRRVRVLSYGSIKGLRPREVLSRGSGGGR